MGTPKGLSSNAIVHWNSPDAMRCCLSGFPSRVAKSVVGGSMRASVIGSAHAVSYGLGSLGSCTASNAALHTTLATGNNIGVFAGTVQVRSTEGGEPNAAPAKKNTPSTYS